MDHFFPSLVSFLAILNPFALCLYLVGVMEDLDFRAFVRVMSGACIISFIVFSIFALAGESVLIGCFHVKPNALRVFGGVIFLIVGYNYVVKGYRTTELLRGSLEELPSAIALPFMIGAGTLTQSILIGKLNSRPVALLILLAGIAISFFVVFAFRAIRDRMKTTREKVFDRYVNIMVRINGLLVGAISTEMIVSGIREMWQSP